MWTKSTTVWFRDDFYFIFYILQFFNDMKLQSSKFFFWDKNNIFVKEKKNKKEEKDTHWGERESLKLKLKFNFSNFSLFLSCDSLVKREFLFHHPTNLSHNSHNQPNHNSNNRKRTISLSLSLSHFISQTFHFESHHQTLIPPQLRSQSSHFNLSASLRKFSIPNFIHCLRISDLFLSLSEFVLLWKKPVWENGGHRRIGSALRLYAPSLCAPRRRRCRWILILIVFILIQTPFLLPQRRRSRQCRMYLPLSL